MKKIIVLLMAVFVLLSTVACGQKNPKVPSPSENVNPNGSESQKEIEGETTDPPVNFKVGLVLSIGGLGDKNFNDMSYEGLVEAQNILGISFDYLESESPSDYAPNFRMFCETGEYDLIIGMGSDQADGILEVVEDFPEQKFSHIDSALDDPRVSAVATKWQEQTFLTGVMAGLGTTGGMKFSNADANVVGVILGMDNPVLRAGVVGYIAGVKYVNRDCEVLEGVVDSFNDPGKGKEIALSMYNQGADFVQSIAGASGLGIYNAAKDAGRYAFGVGANVNYHEPDNIPATALRNVNEMVFSEIKRALEGEWEGNLRISGIAEGSVGIDMTQTNVEIPSDILTAIEDIRQLIVDGKLEPPETADMLEQWLDDNHYQG